jgi:rhodanese-related sulfurtransferase
MLPQVLVWSNHSPNECFGRQRQGNLGFASASGYVNVLVSQAKQMIESNPSLVILDVRSQAEYDSGHLQNATLIPVTDLARRLYELDKQKDILVYCGSGGRSATASQTLVDNGFPSVYNMLGGITSWKNAGYSIEIVHNGDLIIHGTQNFVIENCTYIQTGNICIMDSATLLIRNTLLHMKNEYAIQLNMTATLRLKNANVSDTPSYPVGATYLYENSTLDMAFAQYDSTIHQYDYSTIIVTNSTVAGINPVSHGVIYIYNSTVNWLQIGWCSDIFIYFSTVVNLGSGGNIYVCNSTLDSPHIYLHTDATLTDLNPGFYKDWNIHTNETTLETYNTTLVNTTVERGWGISIGIAWEYTYRNPKVNVYNSTLVYFGASDCNPFVYFNNCSLIWLDLWDFGGTLQFDSSQITLRQPYPAVISNSHFYIRGNITLIYDTISTALYRWENTTVTRNFDMVTLNKTSEPLGDVQLSLFGKYRTLVWSGSVDDFGGADFNLTFTDSNYTDTLTLEVTKDNFTSSRDIAFLTDTPVTFVRGMTGDINNDDRVDMKDVSYVARRFMCLPSDPLWDSIADLNSDGKVDMKDISIIAKHFGEHYP